MHQSTLIRLLKTFSEQELRSFQDFVSSPYYNKNTNLIRLSRHLEKFHPEFDSEEVKKENSWKELFGNRIFNYGVMKNLIYELHKLAEKFLSTEFFESRRLQQDIYLLEKLKQKKLLGEVEKNIREVRKKLSLMTKNTEYFFQKASLEKIENVILELNLKTKDKKHGDYSVFNKSLLSYFFSYFFLAGHKALNVANMYRTGHQHPDLEKVMRFFEKEYPGIDVLSTFYYYSLRLAMENRNEKLYFEVKDFVLSNYREFDHNTAYNSFTTLLRTCSDITLTDDTVFAHETFEVTKFMIRNKIYSSKPGGYIDHTFFYQAVDIAAHHNDSAWCESFISEYGDKLVPDVRENYINLAMMLLSRSRKNYEESQNFLSKVVPENVLQKLTVKEFEIKNFYDLGHYDELYGLIKNVKSYLRNDKIFSPVVKSAVKNFTGNLKKILDIKLSSAAPRDKSESLNDIKKEISAQDVFNKSWLLRIASDN